MFCSDVIWLINESSFCLRGLCLWGKHRRTDCPTHHILPHLQPFLHFVLAGSFSPSNLVKRGAGNQTCTKLHWLPCTVTGWAWKPPHPSHRTAPPLPSSIFHWSWQVGSPVSQLALRAGFSNWIMDFSTQHQLSYVEVCGDISGSKLWVGTGESLYLKIL